MTTISTANFYQSLGFNSNPFEGNAAEREPEIEHYAVRPPYLDPVDAASRKMGSYTLSGTRGSGKSATRITVQRSMWVDDEPHPLPISLINFNAFRQVSSPQELMLLFAEQTFFLTIEACLIYSTTKKDDSFVERMSQLNSSDKKFCDWAMQTYYLSRPEEARKVSAQECMDAFSLSFARKSKLWADKKWDAITGSLIQISAAVAKKFDLDVGDTATLKEVFAAKNATSTQDPSYVLKRSVEFARLMGFSSLLVQIDKLDETDWTTNNPEAAAKLIWPLLSNIQLHEIDGLSWSIFLWDRVRVLLNSENDLPVRWDKLPNDVIKWDTVHLERLVEARLEHFSNKNMNKLLDMFEPQIGVENADAEKALYQQLFNVSGVAPRTLINVLNVVLASHIQKHEGIGTKLSVDSLAEGLDKYAVTTILDSFNSDTVNQLKKVGLLSFVTKDVTKAFSISGPGALKKIERWIQFGLVRRDGQIYAQPNSGVRTKPVDRFAVSELRVKRIIERSLEVAL